MAEAEAEAVAEAEAGAEAEAVAEAEVEAVAEAEAEAEAEAGRCGGVAVWVGPRDLALSPAISRLSATNSWKPVPPVLPPVDLVGMGVGAGAGAAAAGSGRRALSSRSLASSSANLHRIVHRIVHCIVHVHGVRSTRCTVPCMPAACAVGLLY